MLFSLKCACADKGSRPERFAVSSSGTIEWFVKTARYFSCIAALFILLSPKAPIAPKQIPCKFWTCLAISLFPIPIPRSSAIEKEQSKVHINKNISMLVGFSDYLGWKANSFTFLRYMYELFIISNDEDYLSKHFLLPVRLMTFISPVTVVPQYWQYFFARSLVYIWQMCKQRVTGNVVWKCLRDES